MTTKTHLSRALVAATILAATVIGVTGPASAAPRQLCLSTMVQAESDDPNATAKALDKVIAEMRIAGNTAEQIDATLSTRYGMKAMGKKSAPQNVIEPMSGTSVLSVPAPTIYYESCARYWWVYAKWDFNSIPQLKSDAGSCNNCAVGPYDVFGIAFSRDIADPRGWSGSSWGATTVYGPANRNIGDTSNHGAAVEDQDRFCRGGTCAADDYNMYHGQLIYTMDVIGCGNLTVHSKYGHSWSSVTLNDVTISLSDVSITWSNATYSWNKAGAGPSNTVRPC